MAVISSTLQLSITDNASAEARKIDNALRGLRDQEDRTRRQFDMHRNAFMGTAAVAIAAGYAMRAPIEAAMAFENKLVDIQQKARLTKDELEKLGTEIRTGGLETGLGAQEYGSAVDSLMAGGMDVQTALTAANPLARTAIAYEASIDDMTAATDSLLTNLNISVTELESAFDVMSAGASAGKFELRDMAKEFPTLSAAANKMGIQGKEGLADLVAALEVAFPGSGTGSAAANNMENFMSKVEMPDAVKKFKDLGIDIAAEIDQAVANGESPLEHTLMLIKGLVDSGKVTQGELFADSEVNKFLNAMLPNLELYRQIRDEAISAEGTVAKDYALRMDSSGGIVSRFEASIQELNLALASSLTPKLMEFVKSVTPMVDSVGRWVSANDEMVAAIMEIVGGLVGLRLLTSAGGMAGALLGLGGGSLATSAGIAGTAFAGTAFSKAGAAGTTFGNSAYGKIASAFLLFELAKTAQDNNILQPPDPNKSWHHNVFEQLDPVLAKMLYEGYNPLPAIGEKVSGLGNHPLTGGAESEEMASIRAMLAENDSGASPLHPIELKALRDELAALEGEASAAGNAAGLSLQTGFGTQMPAVAAEMQSMMARLRVIAGSGVTIPMRLNGPVAAQPSKTLPGFSSGGYTGNGSASSIAGLVHGREFVMNAAATARHGALLASMNAGLSMPTLSPIRAPGGTPAAAGGGNTIVNIGDIILSNPTNADPRTISRMMGTVVSDRMRASHSNGAM